MEPSAPDPDYQEIELDIRDAVSQSIFSATLAPGTTDCGTEADLYNRTVRLRIGRRPTVKRLLSVYQELGAAAPKEVEELAVFRRHDVWLLAFHIHLLREEGLSSVREFGCQVKYPEGRSIAILSAMPESELLKLGKFSLESSAEIGITGAAELSQETASAASGGWVPISAGVKAKLSTEAKLSLSLSVVSPKVTCIGRGDCLGEWSIRRAEEPLLGEQAFVHTLLVPKNMKSMAFSVRSYAVVDTLGMFPGRLNSSWVDFKIDLAGGANVAVEKCYASVPVGGGKG